MRGPAGAFVLTGLQLLGGTFLFMVAASLAWRSISRGYFRSTTWVLAPLLLALSLLLPSQLRPIGWVAAGAMAMYLVAVYSERPLVEWATAAAAALSVIAILWRAGYSLCPAGCVLGSMHALAGAMFLGSVTHGMTLGHWYLNQPRLPLGPLKGATAIMAVFLLPALALGMGDRAELVSGVAPAGVFFLSRNGFWWTWLLLWASTAATWPFIRATVWSRSTQSATGLLYVAMVPALGAQFLLSLLAAT